MKLPNLGFCFFFFFILFALQTASPTFPEASTISLPNCFGFFLFGDSYVDAGNNNYINTTADFQANFPPYGKTFFHLPTGRFTDGRTIPDFLAEYAGLPLIPPYLDPHNDFYDNGVNFASSGSGALAESHKGSAIGLQTQMKFFKKVMKSLRKKLGNASAQTLISNSVFLFNFGGNDYLNPFDISYDIFNTSSAQERFVNMVVGNITIALKEVYKYGGRKFGFMTVPPLGHMPSSRIKRSVQFFEEASSITRLHNQLLPDALQKLGIQLKGFKYAFADTHTLLLQRIINPIKYGFKVTETACCGSGAFRGIYNCGRNVEGLPFTECDNLEDYVFFDSFHPTEKLFKQLAELIWSGDAQIVNPYNFKQLFEYGSMLASY
ncbi:GDSL esterase/lipase 2-like isoform X1 [Cucurbita maxima]|uniref:GDSL esterase/lipase 2-like isoform X1 n=1 Tax=Cucurbita maxima TaxID=3661 RepID=A0A6J1L1A1_CUCMA|nr:GDSL esterase/lipase 2-like isoform X1 [Cucurbita maxima]